MTNVEINAEKKHREFRANFINELKEDIERLNKKIEETPYERLKERFIKSRDFYQRTLDDFEEIDRNHNLLFNEDGTLKDLDEETIDEQIQKYGNELKEHYEARGAKADYSDTDSLIKEIDDILNNNSRTDNDLDNLAEDLDFPEPEI